MSKADLATNVPGTQFRITNAPTNHADRPLLVTRNAVIVAISIMTTAPGQNCKLIGVGPMT